MCIYMRRMAAAAATAATAMPVLRAHSAQVPARDAFAVDMEVNGDVVVLQYPASCHGAAFVQSYSEASRTLTGFRRPFRLVHDLRETNLSTLRLDECVSHAIKIARSCDIEGVAFVLNDDVSPTLFNALALGLWMSPVQPARGFKNKVDAMRWANEGWRHRKGLRR